MRLRPPVPRLYELFDCVVHPSFSKASTRCNTLFCHSGEGEVQKCSKIAATMERKGAFVAFFGQDTHLSVVKDDVMNISRAFSRSYFSGVDIDLLGIDVMPIGLTEFYLRDQDYWNVLPLLHSPKPSSQRITPTDCQSKPFVRHATSHQRSTAPSAGMAGGPGCMLRRISSTRSAMGCSRQSSSRRG